MTIAPSIDIFPFDSLKPGQGIMLHALTKHRFSLVQAPTGFGKTAVVLSATLPELWKGKQLIIATRTKSQIFDVFLPKLVQFKRYKAPTPLSYVPLIAQTDLCIHPDRNAPDTPKCRRCPQNRRTQTLTDETLTQIADYTSQIAPTPKAWRDTLAQAGCPYHLVKRLCAYVHIVFTSHGHLTHPYLQNQLFQLTQADKAPQTKILVLDEVHGLASPTVVEEIALETLRAAAKLYPVEGLVKFVKECKHPGQVQRTLWAPEIATFLDKDRDRWTTPRFRPLLDLYKFLKGQGDYWVCTEEQVIQFNPFPDLVFQTFDQFSKVIAMSGTLVPLKYYIEFFNIPHYQPLELPAPPKELLLTFTSELRFSSAHENHKPQTYRTYAEAIWELHVINPAHTLVACASHDMKDHLQPYLKTNYVEDPRYPVPLWLPELQTSAHEMILAVMGGRVTEGLEIIDPATKCSKITLIIIAGLPFPARNVYQDHLMYLYTHRYSRILAEQHLVYLPTYTKLLQTVGRGVRSSRDYSAVVVLDYRADQFRLGHPQTCYSQFDMLLSDLFHFYRQQRKKR